MAAEKKNQAKADINDLLSFNADDEKTTPDIETDSLKAVPENASAPSSALSFDDIAEAHDVAEDAELDSEIAALKAALAAPEKSEPELSPKQKELADLRAQIEERQAREALAVRAATFDVVDEGTETITIHILEDGFTCQGEVFYRGQEIVFPVGGKAIEQTKDRNGVSWLDMRDDDDAQYERYGKVYFRSGVWPYKPWTKLSKADMPIDQSSPADVEKAIKAEQKRRRLAPIL